MKRRSMSAVACVCLALAGFSGCAKKETQVAPSAPPAIPVSNPITREVTDYIDFTGRTEAQDSVNIVPRVTGYLVSAPFKEGAEVKSGDLLFEIDPRPYQAQYDQAEGQVLLAEARVKEATADNLRAKALAKTPGAISQQDLDRYQAAEEESIAAVQAAKASLEIYKLNLGFCKVTSPIDGQVSRYYLTVGNLVNQDQTQLTTVVSMDPMYVYFDVDETTLLRVRKAINDGTIMRYEQGEIPVFISLEGEDNFPHQGTINFVNNRVNSGTGSITVRGVVPNAKPANGIRLLTPGMFVRVRLPIGKPHEALLVIDRAIGSDQGLKFVYVLDSKNQAQQRRIETGPLQEDGLRVITSGLKPDDWVAVGGIQQIRPRMPVAPDRHPMPTLGAAVADTVAKDKDANDGAPPSGDVPAKPASAVESKGATSDKSEAEPAKGGPASSGQR
jgi:multidrug efflux system membrane fusion protein